MENGWVCRGDVGDIRQFTVDPCRKPRRLPFILKLLMQDMKDLITSGPVKWVFIDRITGKQHRRKMIFRLMMIIVIQKELMDGLEGMDLIGAQ